MKSSFSKRLKQALNTSGMKQVDVINKSKLLYEETGVKISKTDLSQYVNGKTEPGQKKLYVLAKVLNVSEAWLLGYDVPTNRPTDEERAVKNSFETIAAHLEDDLTEEEWQEVIEYAEFIKSKRKK
ncbi:helix-turn-helix domain-containing protein [Staphylococcus cohnii]|uniref:Helix-turn-helix domain-containing protein n=1 Tax=Staphylococcus cohnii TaxID=29382 RepID=A0ABT6J0C0_9STAP|nr:helix-turn-helix domain-containing protein [Staphylococcus cohnii]MDH5140034.1 helix-turn-helix domain-containing protein [Staphylococcus cohnii]MDH5157917.1 helix-turn-helix domain-containing protein [Staphylococcus cohnii]MDH5169656.1 helix-turn-helix domain-containing protein [Staphylococcus cohnii]